MAKPGDMVLPTASERRSCGGFRRECHPSVWALREGSAEYIVQVQLGHLS
jgi:hypothetical protein